MLSSRSLVDDAHFDVDWLALREPVDHRSRAAAIVPLLRQAWRAVGWSRVLDLGCGTGSNLRYLAPKLDGPQEWTVLDHDQELLSRVTVPDAVQRVTRVHGELAREGLTAVEHTHLVTGAALLDLVSEDWLVRLIAACRVRACGAHFALTYDGTTAWFADAARRVRDDDPDDTLIRRAVNDHQRRDKGLGPALGPMAGLVAETRFRAAGYRAWLLPSPWHLGPGDATLARRLVESWQVAATDTRPDVADRVQAWAGRRREVIDRGTFAISVGHVDLLALPPPQQS